MSQRFPLSVDALKEEVGEVVMVRGREYDLLGF